MKKMFLTFILFIGITGCTDNSNKNTIASNDGTVDINGKKCEIMIINHPSRRLYYVDCPTGASVTFKSGKASSTTIVTNTPSPTTETSSCPMPAHLCNCK